MCYICKIERQETFIQILLAVGEENQPEISHLKYTVWKTHDHWHICSVRFPSDLGNLTKHLNNLEIQTVISTRYFSSSIKNIQVITD